MAIQTFFVDPNGDLGNTTVVTRAKRICEGCEVILPCREYAIGLVLEVGGDVYGVWGGMSQTQLKAEAKRRRKQ
jgi:hypothetical protein